MGQQTYDLLLTTYDFFMKFFISLACPSCRQVDNILLPPALSPGSAGSIRMSFNLMNRYPTCLPIGRLGSQWGINVVSRAILKLGVPPMPGG